MRRFFTWFVHAILMLDHFGLLVARWLTDFCNDWLSFSQRRLELFLIGLHMGMCLGSRLGLVSGFSSWSLFFPLAWFGTYWPNYTRPDAVRVRMLFDSLYCGARLFLCAFVVLINLPWAYFKPDFSNLLDVVSGLVLALFLYVTSLPRGNPPSGRKRKEVFSKLTEQFGTPSIPSPQYNEGVTCSLYTLVTGFLTPRHIRFSLILAKWFTPAILLAIHKQLGQAFTTSIIE